MDPNNLPGPLKVAILIKSVGEDASQKILNTMSEGERELIRRHMSQLGEVSPDLVEKVAKDFTENINYFRPFTGKPHYEQHEESQCHILKGIRQPRGKESDKYNIYSKCADKNPKRNVNPYTQHHTY